MCIKQADFVTLERIAQSFESKLIPIDELKPFLMVAYRRTLKNSIFVKILNFSQTSFHVEIAQFKNA